MNKTFSTFINENTLADIKNKWKSQFDILLVGEYTDGDIEISSLIVPKGERKHGIGTAFMKDLCDYADANNKRILLSPGYKDDHHGTTSHGRLVSFYKRFGFVQNKGRNKDFRISHTMIRNPI